MFVDDVRKRFPQAYPCGGDLMAHVDGKNVVLGTFANGGFNLTPLGQKMMDEQAQPVEEVEPEVPAPKTRGKVKHREVVDLDDLLGE